MISFPDEPKGSWLMIETSTGPSAWSAASSRTYELSRPYYKNCYRSSVSAGQECWTDQAQGPNGEPIVEHREWVLISAGGYIGSFERWEGMYGVREYFTAFLRREITDLMEG